MDQQRKSNAVPRVAFYCATFLKPEMLHIYRQITSLRRFDSVVFAQKREHATRFPVGEFHLVPKSRWTWLQRIVFRQILNAPMPISAGEARRFSEQLAAAEISLLHIFFGHIGVRLLPLLERRERPSVVSFHGADGLVELERPKFRAATLRMLAVADRLVVRSHSLRGALLALGCPAEKIRLHRTGIPLASFPYQPRTAPADGAWHVVQACRLIEKKGLRTTLRAFALFRESFPAARLTIAGEGPLRAELETFAAELGLTSATNFSGFLVGEALGELYRSAHFFLHPSELGADGNQEGVPNSLLEAMAAGVPPLATRHGGIPEAVEPGVSGILVEERDHAALARALADLAHNPARAEAMGRAAAAAVRANFDLERQGEVLAAIYEEVLREDRLSARRTS